MSEQRSGGGGGAGGGASSKAGQRFGPYQVGETIGRGTFAKVKIAYHESTKIRVALKIISRKVMETDPNSARKIKREIKIMRVLRHPHITRLYDVVKTKHDIVLVMEYISGGELFDYISRKGRLDEATGRALFQQLAAAVAYCHRYRVTHRDIKPENIMMEHGSHNIKLSDFGLSSITHDGRFFETSCGTPNYASPEVVSGALYGGPETDVWSCGVVLYAMLCGCLPFDDANIGALFKKIQSAQYTMPSYVSPLAQDLLRRMLVVNPLERATMEQIMQHPFLRPNFPHYLLSLHYSCVLETTRFAKDYYMSEEMLDEEVIQVVASRFRISPQQVSSIVMGEEERLPSMRAIVSDDEVAETEEKSHTRRYPAANYWEMFSNVLDSKLWPTPVEIVPAEVALRDETHDIYVSYCILTQKKQNKLAPQELSNKSFGENASSLLQSQSQQGYGSLNAHSLHQASANSSFTGGSLKGSMTQSSVKSPSSSKSHKKSGETTFQNLPTQASPSEGQSGDDMWLSGYNRVSAPFLPLHSEQSKHTLIGGLLHVNELPIRLLRSRSLAVTPVTKGPASATTANTENLLTPGSATTCSVTEGCETSTGPMKFPSTGSLLKPQRSTSTTASPAIPVPQRNSSFSSRTPTTPQQADRRGQRPETALETLYHVDVVTRFGNDFIRNGVCFVNSAPLETLKHVYAAMQEEGLLWRVIYDYYFSCVRFPNVKIQVKVYKVNPKEQIVDVKVSVQSGMAAYDVAISLLERLRAKAVMVQNAGSKKQRSLLTALKGSS